MTTKVIIKAEVHQGDRAVKVIVYNPNGGEVWRDLTLIDKEEVELYVYDSSAIKVSEIERPKPAE